MKSFHLIFNGLGAGNIGDEAMLLGFLNTVPPDIKMTIEVWDIKSSVLQTLPDNFTYINYTDYKSYSKTISDAEAVLLVGDTPVMEDWGLEWPMQYHSRRFRGVVNAGKQIYAFGVGVDRLHSEKARELFKENHLLINNWSVRSQNCYNSLITLGVQNSKICIGADYAWLFHPENDHQIWAEGFFLEHGIKVDSPIIGINVVNEKWANNIAEKQKLAHVLDKVHHLTDAQIIFLCNETRDGNYFDKAAAQQVSKLMKSPSIIIPNIYFSPAQMIALLSFCTLTISQRYHFTVLSIIAKTPVLSFARGQKIISLLEELNQFPIGEMEGINKASLSNKIIEGLNNRDNILTNQQETRYYLSARAYKNSKYLYKHLNNDKTISRLSLAKLSELKSTRFESFMNVLNNFSSNFNLRQFTNWSKIWEYPWVWFNSLCEMDLSYLKILDIGSELSPMPWFLSALGAHVTIVETSNEYTTLWKNINVKSGAHVNWFIVESEHLPFPENYFDVVSSFSVIEHQTNKHLAINEISRILKPNGTFAMSFDICESDMGMIFPEWNGRALTMKEFEELVWNNPSFNNEGKPAKWNVQDCDEFIKWHLQSATHHNYVVGAAVLKKAK